MMRGITDLVNNNALKEVGFPHGHVSHHGESGEQREVQG